MQDLSDRNGVRVLGFASVGACVSVGARGVTFLINETLSLRLNRCGVRESESERALLGTINSGDA